MLPYLSVEMPLDNSPCWIWLELRRIGGIDRILINFLCSPGEVRGCSRQQQHPFRPKAGPLPRAHTCEAWGGCSRRGVTCRPCECQAASACTSLGFGWGRGWGPNWICPPLSGCPRLSDLPLLAARSHPSSACQGNAFPCAFHFKGLLGVKRGHSCS